MHLRHANSLVFHPSVSQNIISLTLYAAEAILKEEQVDRILHTFPWFRFCCSLTTRTSNTFGQLKDVISILILCSSRYSTEPKERDAFSALELLHYIILQRPRLMEAPKADARKLLKAAPEIARYRDENSKVIRSRGRLTTASRQLFETRTMAVASL
jgi:hypothetical protein